MTSRLVAVGVAAALALAVGAVAGPRDMRVVCAAEVIRSAPAQRPHYALTVRVAPSLRRASGTLRVTFAPAVATDRIVLRLWPNGPAYATRGAKLTVGAVTTGRRILASLHPDPTTLVVRRHLSAGQEVTLSMRWALTLPAEKGQRLYGGRYARLGSFFPLLAWDGSGWAVDPPTLGPFETWTSPTSDFDVRVTTPPHLRVLASGEEVAPGRWRARAVRDFAMAVGRFAIVRRSIRVPAPVWITVGVAPGVPAPPSRYLNQAASVLRTYSRRYGAYPWRTYTLAAMPDTLGHFSGIEYPTIVYLLGQPSRLVVAHETGHQWFYSLVGNDQARDPWLDESLATWAHTRYEGTLEQALRTRIPAGVRNRLGEPMRFWEAFDGRTTFVGLYIQGVQALASLGDPARVDCALRHYVAVNAYRTATPRDLLTALEPFFPNARAKLVRRGVHF